MNIALLLAAGSSKRIGKDKLFLPVLGKPLIYYSLQALHDHPDIHSVIIVASKKNKEPLQKLVKKFHFPRVKKIIVGGKERQYSVQNGLKSIKEINAQDIVIIHNGANPLVTQQEVTQVVAAAKKSKAAAVGKKVVDTIKEVREGHFIKTHEREKLIATQTPQAVQYDILRKAFDKAKKDQRVFTDEAALIENIGYKVKHIPASADNFKITTLHDYEHCKIILGDTPKNFLVGIGQDSHPFSTHQKGLKMGGFLLKKEPKLEADSDGDVVLHALYNALSQAIGEGSLGQIATPLYKEKGITVSKDYLQPLLEKISKKKYELNNIGFMIEAKKPKIDPIVPQMKKSLSVITGLPQSRIGITATTGDNLTSFGRGEGIQCFAIVSLKKHER